MAASLSRRTLLGSAATLPLLPSAVLRAAEPDLSALRDITGGANPIDAAERARRLSRAQALMKANGMGAVLIEPGSSMIYFTGVRWGRSERPTLAILPVEGSPCIVTPFFEEPSVRETLGVPGEVRVWQEDADPLAVAAGFLRDRGLHRRAIGIEETVRSFIAAGLTRNLPDTRQLSANPVVRGCRMIKTPAELALMQLATEVTIAAYRWVHPRIEKGTSGHDIGALMDAATVRLGGSPEFSLVLIGEAAAYPHGSRTPHLVADGEIVLMDCGCTVQGYQSDVSRTFVHGAASKQQRTVWGQVARGSRSPSPPPGSAPPPAASMTRCAASTPRSATAPTTRCPACRIAPATASGSTGTNRSIWSAAKPPGSRRACAFRMNPVSTSPAYSACGWRIAST